MNTNLIEHIVNEFHTLVQFKLELNDIINAFVEYDGELTPTLIHQEIQNIVTMAIRENPKLSHGFDLKVIEESKFSYLKKYIVHTRRAELKDVKIVISKKKYDITELRSTYYGKLILKDIKDIGQRRLLGYDEYKVVKETFMKLNLDLPEEIKPTTTETLFNEIFGEE